MRRRDDDLSPFREDPLFQALTGPATPDELAGEAEALAAFRAAGGSRSRRRFAARLGASGTVAVAALALSGGVAAAYTASWPAPVQRVLHAALGPIDVPPPPVHHRAKSTDGSPSQSAGATASPAPVPAPSQSPSPHSSGTPSAKPTASASPTATPTASPDVTPSSSPVVTPPLGVRPPLPGASLAITPSSTHVLAGESVTVGGQLLDATGTPVVGREIALLEHSPGVPGWTRFEALPTSLSGDVTFNVPGLVRNERFVLRAGGRVHSTMAAVVVKPTITPTVAPAEAGSRTTTVTMTVVGAQAGDVVVLDRFGKHRIVRTAELDSSGQAVFTIPVPLHHTVHYRIGLPRTEAHAFAVKWFMVAPVVPAA